MSGEANQKTKVLNLKMTVRPKGTGALLSAPIGLLGGPVGIAGVWFLDQVTGSKISGMLQYEYFVTGTWEKPNIQTVGDRKSR